MENEDKSGAYKRMSSNISDDTDNDVSGKMFKQETDNLMMMERGATFNSQGSAEMEKGGEDDGRRMSEF